MVGARAASPLRQERLLDAGFFSLTDCDPVAPEPEWWRSMGGSDDVSCPALRNRVHLDHAS
jgi:hypothetical protein